MIYNYGLNWKRENIDWKQGICGRHKKKGPIINFNDQTAIYILYKDERVIYIGQTGSKAQKLFGRLKQHKEKLDEKWNKFSWFGISKIDPKEKLQERKSDFSVKINVALNQIEAILIHHTTKPSENYKTGNWSGAEEYAQLKIDEIKKTSSLKTPIPKSNKKRDSLSPKNWVKKIPELALYGDKLNKWSKVCNKLKIDTGKDSAYRALKRWVKKERPEWPPVP